jgi:hypothetical protein
LLSLAVTSDRSRKGLSPSITQPCLTLLATGTPDLYPRVSVNSRHIFCNSALMYRKQANAPTCQLATNQL